MSLLDILPLQNDMMDAFKKNHGQIPLPEPNLPPISGLVTVSKAGEQTLFTIFVIMLISTLIFYGLALRLPKKGRLFYEITGTITLFASISYFCMSTGLGEAIVPARGHHAYRVVLLARYADWLVTTPLLLLDLMLLAGSPGMDMLVVIIMDLVMIVTGLLAALHPSLRHRWGLFAFSCAAMVYVLYNLLVPGYQFATKRHTRVGQAYIGIAVFSVVLWSLYPVVWAFGEGTNIINADSEVLFYGILDVLAKPVFGVLLVVAHDKIAEADVSLPDWFVKPRGASSGYSPISSSE